MNIGRLQLGRLEASLRGGFAIVVANIQCIELAEATKKPVRLANGPAFVRHAKA
jgi:hypothetical protein